MSKHIITPGIAEVYECYLDRFIPPMKNFNSELHKIISNYYETRRIISPIVKPKAKDTRTTYIRKLFDDLSKKTTMKNSLLDFEGIILQAIKKRCIDHQDAERELTIKSFLILSYLLHTNVEGKGIKDVYRDGVHLLGLFESNLTYKSAVNNGMKLYFPTITQAIEEMPERVSIY